MNWIKEQLERFQAWLDTLSDTQRQFLLAGSLLVAALIIGFILYWVFFRPLLQQGTVEDQVNINGELVNYNQLPDILRNLNKEGINAEDALQLPDIDIFAKGGNTLAQSIYNENAQNAVLSADGTSVRFYDPETGLFYTIDENGNLVAISDKKFPGVEQVTWSNDTNKAVMELQDGFNILYDFNTDQQYTLNAEMDDFDFSPSDTQISFKYLPENSSERWLGVSNLDGSGAVGIERLGDNGDDVNAQWSPSGQAVATFTENINSSQKDVFVIGFRGENFKKFQVDGRGFDYEWSPNGRQMMYSVYDPKESYISELHIVDSYGEDIGANNAYLGINTTADKCTFTDNGASVYCAVPVDPPVGSGIAPETLNDVQHDIYKIDLDAGTSVKIATPADTSGDTLLAPQNVMVNEDESVLYYTEAETGHLRRILLD